MLRAYVVVYGGNWYKFINPCEFSYINRYHSSIDKEQIEALYSIGCRSPIGWFESEDVKPWG